VLSVFGGALGVGIGLGLQKLASNYIAGFTILLDRSVRIGDLVTIDNRHGMVASVTARYVLVRSLDGVEAIIPNETLVTTTVLNHSYTAKDLRTWNATVLAAVTLAGAAADGVPTAQRARARLVTAAMNEVAEHLGNTPTVARSSYVDPRVIERFEDGRTLLPTLRRNRLADPLDDEGRAVLDRAVVRLLKD